MKSISEKPAIAFPIESAPMTRKTALFAAQDWSNQIGYPRYVFNLFHSTNLDRAPPGSKAWVITDNIKDRDYTLDAYTIVPETEDDLHDL
jgi:hypothetical protein